MRSAPDRTRLLHLADDRRLAYTVTGPDHGQPVIYCHGAIGTPVDATVDLGQMAELLGVRYIAPSRPGVGFSEAKPGRTIMDFASDLEQLANALDLGSFSVVGVSAGGPYALACAHALGDRVERVAVVSSLSPLCPPHATPGLRKRVRLALKALHANPRKCTALADCVLPVLARHPGLVTAVIKAHAAPGEQQRLAGAGESHAASSSFLDACCRGASGLIEDFLVYSQAWGFDVAAINTTVQLWHGAADPLVPVEHALQLAATLPRCRVFLDPDEGHHFFRSSIGRILATLVDPGGATAGQAPTAQSAAMVPGNVAQAPEAQAAARSSTSGGRSTS